MAKATTFLAFILLIIPAVYGANINVGGTSGWSLGVNYVTWAQGQTFTTQDVLVFTYGPIHSVEEVSQADYLNCNPNNPISSNSPSPTSISLSPGGTRYFICPTSSHCSQGMKLAVTVTNGSGAGTPPPSGTTPSPPSGTTPSPPSGTTPSTPAPPPPSGDATVVLGGWNSLFVGVLVVVAALFGVIG